MTLTFGILGPLEVHDGTRRIHIGGRRNRVVLAVLLLHANKLVTKDRLVDDLYGGHPPSSATASLQNVVAALRRSLPTLSLETRVGGYMLRIEPHQFDLALFKMLVSSAETAPPDERARVLREALRLWRGEALADLAYETFAEDAARPLEALRLIALEKRITADLELGRHAALVSELGGLCSAHPFHEGLRLKFMLALNRCGLRADALREYETIAALLRDLGLEPGPELQRLQIAIREGAAGISPDDHLSRQETARRRRSFALWSCQLRQCESAPPSGRSVTSPSAA